MTCDYNRMEAERRLWNTIKLVAAVGVFLVILAAITVGCAIATYF